MAERRAPGRLLYPLQPRFRAMAASIPGGDLFGILFPLVHAVGYFIALFAVHALIGALVSGLTVGVMALNLLFVNRFRRLESESLAAREALTRSVDTGPCAERLPSGSYSYGQCAVSARIGRGGGRRVPGGPEEHSAARALPEAHAGAADHRLYLAHHAGCLRSGGVRQNRACLDCDDRTDLPLYSAADQRTRHCRTASSACILFPIGDCRKHCRFPTNTPNRKALSVGSPTPGVPAVGLRGFGVAYDGNVVLCDAQAVIRHGEITSCFGAKRQRKNKFG